MCMLASPGVGPASNLDLPIPGCRVRFILFDKLVSASLNFCLVKTPLTVNDKYIIDFT